MGTLHQDVLKPVEHNALGCLGQLQKLLFLEDAEYRLGVGNQESIRKVFFEAHSVLHGCLGISLLRTCIRDQTRPVEEVLQLLEQNFLNFLN